jgi:hypothetical protein
MIPLRTRHVVQVVGLIVAAVVAAVIGQAPAHAESTTGQVVDAHTHEAIEGAVVTAGDTVVTTDAAGRFALETEAATLRLRSVGYQRRDVAGADLSDPTAPIALQPFAPKGLYLSFYGIGSTVLRGAALRLIERTELNALVIDVKSDYGKIPYESAVSLAAQVGAHRSHTISDIRALMRDLHERSIYTIARIVVFKDNLLAQGRPDLAVTTGAGAVWRDREHLAWTDPFRKEVWEYNIAIAVEAAENGFDEIQFDYVRFPDATGLSYAQESTRESRTRAIDGFLAAARRRLVRFNVFLAADIFGYVCWNRNDTMIGQRIEDLPAHLDLISPMLYPSSFQFGIPGYRNPVAHPYEIVYLSLEQARRRTGLAPTRFRPWLQAFRDYGFDRRLFAEREIRAQVDAAERVGANGWMLWNAHNVYSPAGLRTE